MHPADSRWRDASGRAGERDGLELIDGVRNRVLDRKGDGRNH